jgi:hypothetical protein
MRPGADLPRDLPDRIIRESLRNRDNRGDFLRHAVPQLAGGFDFGRARLLDREFPMPDFRRRESDLPFEVPYRTAEGEEPALVCVLIEHQSDTDPLIPLRLLYFVAGYWDKQWQEWAGLERPRPPLRLRPVLPVVLYTGPTPWGSNRTLADLLAEPAAFHTFAPRWEPLFWNLADQTAEGLLQTGVEWLQIMAVMRAGREEVETFRTVVGEAVRRLAGLEPRDEVRWYDLLRIVFAYCAWRRPPAEQPAFVALAVEATPARYKEITAMAQTAAEAWMEQGMAKGEVMALRKVLRRLLTRRFDPLPEPLLQRIEQTADVDRLTAAIEQVEELKSLDELKL